MADVKNGSGSAVVDEYKLTGVAGSWESVVPAATGWDEQYHVKVSNPPTTQGDVTYHTTGGKDATSVGMAGCSNLYVKRNAESITIKWEPSNS